MDTKFLLLSICLLSSALTINAMHHPGKVDKLIKAIDDAKTQQEYARAKQKLVDYRIRHFHAMHGIAHEDEYPSTLREFKQVWHKYHPTQAEEQSRLQDLKRQIFGRK